MKATLIFDLDTPEDKYDFELCSKAVKMKSALWEIYQLTHSAQRHGSYTLEQLCDLIYDELRDFVND